MDCAMKIMAEGRLFLGESLVKEKIWCLKMESLPLNSYVDVGKMIMIQWIWGYTIFRQSHICYLIESNGAFGGNTFQIVYRISMDE